MSVLKVLIADDERIIREGLSNAIDWNSYDFEICGLAENGVAAYNLLQEKQPDLAIIDIRMPGMDGLQLIFKAQEIGLNVKFVILSGYSEFDYAKRAMGLGVKYYLTKPCGDEDLIHTIKSVYQDILYERREKVILTNSLRSYKTSISDAGEKLLKREILAEEYTGDTEASIDYLKLCGFFKQKIRMCILKAAHLEEKNMQALRDLILNSVTDERIAFCAVHADTLAFAINSISLDELKNLTSASIAKEFPADFQKDLSLAFSIEGSFQFLHELYVQATECLRYHLQIREKVVNKKKEAEFISADTPAIHIEKILECMGSGDLKHIQSALKAALPPEGETKLIKACCVAVLLDIIYEFGPGYAYSIADKLHAFEAMDSFEQILLFSTAIILEVAAHNVQFRVKKYSSLVQKIIEYIDENLESTNLSLAYLSREVFFMNEEYLGKVFSKETSQKFSQYVVSRQVCKAIVMLRSTPKPKIYEVSTKSGFGTNTQYFSQVFKNQTGFTPTEFQKL